MFWLFFRQLAAVRVVLERGILFFAVAALQNFGANQAFILRQHASRRRV